MDAEPLFQYMRERHSIHLRRQAGRPWPWTEDPILQQFRFCMVYRELDRTTIWLRDNVRERLRSSPDVLLATVLFRWFNRIRTGEAIFQQTCFASKPGAHTPWELRNDCEPDHFVEILHQAITSYCRTPTGRGYKEGPYVTGSYIIKTPDGKDKLDGVLWCVEQFMTREVLHFEGCSTQREVAQYLLDHPGEVSLEDVWCWLKDFPYLGAFMAAQIVADIKQTDLLKDAPDWWTWASPGPGSMRGLNVVCGREPTTPWKPGEWYDRLRELQLLLEPLVESEGMPRLCAQDVQNNCCEFSKYTRGSSRQKFRSTR